MSESFFVVEDLEAEGGRFRATDLTRGPWDERHQHVGPPAALLGRAIERMAGGDGMMIGRISVDILGPVPIGLMEIRCEKVRPGKNVELVSAVCSVDGRDALRASAWRLRTQPVELDPPPRPDAPHVAPDGPEVARLAAFFPVPWDTGYHTGMEARFLHGSFREAGPALAWLRMRVPLVAGESPSALTRVLCAADSGNGISAPLDYRRYLFVNTELTVHLHRYPQGEWIAMDSRTIASRHGVGLTETDLFDRTSAIGRAAQSLFVRPRD